MPVRVWEAGTRVLSEFVAVGHVTLDRLRGGGEQCGGSAFYSAALAARCGLEVTLVTAGDPDEIEAHLGELLETIDVLVQPAPETTTLLTWFTEGHRCQSVLARAPAVTPVAVRCDVLHLAPILREVPAQWSVDAQAQLVGLTPQGLVRSWDASMTIRLEPSRGLGAYRADVIVLSEHEVPSCRELVDATVGRGGAVVITAAGGPATVTRIEGTVEVPAIPTEVREELGAGDVFASALLVAMRDGKAIEAAVRYAHAAASLRLRHIGAQAIPARRDIDALYAKATPAG
jgi:sugar/nucleoside kinase (ribokinase family)